MCSASLNRTGFPHRRAGGFTILDVMAAVIVATVGLVGLLGMQLTALSANVRAREIAEAMTLCQDKWEQLKTQNPVPSPPQPQGYELVDSRGCLISPVDTRLRCIPALTTGTQYQRTWVQIASNNSYQVAYKVTTSWSSNDNSTIEAGANSGTATTHSVWMIYAN